MCEISVSALYAWVCSILELFLGYLVLLLAVVCLPVLLWPIFNSFRPVAAQFVLLELR